MKINKTLAKKVLKVVDAGLCSGKGKPTPGQMCVEAAVCFAMGLPYSDDPACVSRALRSLKIALNDKAWSSNKARAKGLRRLAIIQLGTIDTLDDKVFTEKVVKMTIQKYVSLSLENAAAKFDNEHKDKLLAAANKCRAEGTKESAEEAGSIAYAAYAYAANAAAYYVDADAYADAADAYAAAADAAYAYAAYAADADADAVAYAAAAVAYAAATGDKDKILSQFSEDVVQILISMKVPAAKWVNDLAPLEG